MDAESILFLQNFKSTVFQWMAEFQAAERAASPEAVAERQAAELRAQLALIRGKEDCSVGEAALLLNMSETAVRTFIDKSRKGKQKPPIPFTQYPGPIYVLPVKELLAWKEHYRGGARRGLQAVANAAEAA